MQLPPSRKVLAEEEVDDLSANAERKSTFRASLLESETTTRTRTRNEEYPEEPGGEVRQPTERDSSRGTICGATNIGL
jgi:hypothetical protein